FMLPWYVLSETKQRVAEAGGAVAAAAAAPVVTGVLLANLNVGMSFSLLNIGSGMIIGLRINVSMMIGGTIGWIIAPYFLVKYGMLTNPETGQVIDTPTYRQVLFWVMWPATGMLVAGGLTSLALRWRMLASTFRSLRAARMDSSEFPLSIVVPGIGISALTLCIVQNQLLGVPVWVTLTAIVLSLPLMLVGLRVLGETNWGPISALSNMMQGVFAGIAPGNVAANMVSSGTTGTIATSSEMIMQDYRCAQIVGTRPRLITIMQLLAVPVGAAAVSLIYPVLVDAYRIIDGIDAAGQPIKAGLPAPISQKWAGFAKILQDGPSALPTSALYALLVASLLGVVLTVLESRPRLKKYVPSPTGLGIAVLVPFAYIFTMFVGSVIGAIWTKLDRRSSELYLVPLGSGFIAGEALVAVIAAIIIGITSA
ncbi:MAG TPA: OPT/YSL family transporter, partial [Kofleriaceae bacterium]|nr:OPT/YSL family transporter [Kofleriaceae bacterium]